MVDVHITHRFMVSWKKLENYHTNLDSNVRPDRILIRVECKYDTVDKSIYCIVYQFETSYHLL